jgi:MFS family permease
MISGLFTPFIAKRIKYKILFLIASVLLSLNFCTGIILHYTSYDTPIIVVVELLVAASGFSSGTLWASQARYIHDMCEQNNMHHKKGYYFGIFFGVYSISQITSGLVTTFMLGFFEVIVYFWILLSIGIISTLFCIFCITDIQTKNATRLSSNSQLLVTQRNDSVNEPVFSAVLRVFRFYAKMIPLLSIIGLVGFAIGFYSSSLHKILEMTIPDAPREYVNMRTGIMFLIMGIGEITGGYLAGRLSDTLTIQKVGVIAVSFYYMSVILSQIAMSFHETMVPVMLAAFLWGLQEAYIQNWVTVICSRTYGGALESFVINKQFHSLTVCIYEIVLIFLQPSLDILLPALLLLGVPCILSLPFIK